MAKKAAKKKVAKKAAVKKKTATKAAKKKVAKKVAMAKKPAGKVGKKTPAAPAGPASGIIGDVEHLMYMMAAHDVTEIDVEDGRRKISLKRGAFMALPTVAAPAMAAAIPAAAVVTAPATAAEAPAKASNLIDITSPMVGTFYAAASPDSDNYVKTGATINDETVVCIVEAMKVMNEIKAECSGTIAEICVKNAEPVEFGQVLFRVTPA